MTRSDLRRICRTGRERSSWLVAGAPRGAPTGLLRKALFDMAPDARAETLHVPKDRRSSMTRSDLRRICRTGRERGSWLVARGSCFVARGSWLVARGSWRAPHVAPLQGSCVRHCSIWHPMQSGPMPQGPQKLNDAVRFAPDLPDRQGEKRRHSGALSRLFDAASPAKTSKDDCTN